ncbi:MAG: hypothetical protein U0350_05755 [Caldilineaceae bacterium]
MLNEASAQAEQSDQPFPRTMTRTAAILYTSITASVIAFQIALAAGAPWGAYAMGGAYPGQFPPALRVAALVQGALLGAMAAIVLARAGLILHRWTRPTRWLVWGVVAFTAVSLVLNLITPSVGERKLWAPVAAVLLVCSSVVALGKSAKHSP